MGVCVSLRVHLVECYESKLQPMCNSHVIRADVTSCKNTENSTNSAYKKSNAVSVAWKTTSKMS